MRTRTKVGAVGAALAAAAATGTGIATAAGGPDDDASEVPITGSALEQASAVALDYTGGGEVTGTEVGDEESYYEIEVTLEDGSAVDVQLDENFTVVGSDADEESSDD